MKSYLVKGIVNGRTTEMEIRAFSAVAAREMFFTMFGRLNVSIQSVKEITR